MKAGIQEIVDHARRGDRARRPRRLRLPPELARDAHPAAHRAGVAHRRLRGLSRCSASRSTRCRSSGSCSPSASSSTTPSSSSRRSSTTSRRACRRATRPSRRCSEVSGPVVAIALILAAVFIPVAFMSGIKGRLYQQFALTIAISVLISAFNALTLCPGALARCCSSRATSRSGLLARFFGGFNRGFDAGDQRLRRASTACLVRKLVDPARAPRRRQPRSPACSARSFPSGFVPDEDQGYAFIDVQLPDGASLQRTERGLRKIDDDPRQDQGGRYYNGIAGFSFFTRTAALQRLRLRLAQAVGRAQGRRADAPADRRRSSTPKLRRRSPRRASSPSCRRPSPASARRAASA